MVDRSIVFVDVIWIWFGERFRDRLFAREVGVGHNEPKISECSASERGLVGHGVCIDFTLEYRKRSVRWFTLDLGEHFLREVEIACTRFAGHVVERSHVCLVFGDVDTIAYR